MRNRTIPRPKAAHRSRSVQGLVFLFVVLLIGSTLANSAPSISCIDQNPLIQMLKDDNVEVFASPEASTSRICAAEWKTHNTCCNSADVTAYARKDTKRTGTAIKELKSDLFNVLEHVTAAEEKLYAAIKNSDRSDRDEYFAKVSQDLARFKDFSESLKKQEATDNRERITCFNRIKQIRTNSLCYTCSGRSSRFFLQGMAMMSFKDCQTTLSDCKDTWRDSLDLFSALKRAVRIQKYIKEVLGEAAVVKFDHEHLQELRNWIGDYEVRIKFKSCLKNPESCAESSVKQICEKFISLTKVDLLQKLEEVAKNPVSEEAPATQGSNRAGWAVKAGRSLQFTVSSNNNNHQKKRLTASDSGMTSMVIVRTYQVPPQLVVPNYNSDVMQMEGP